MVKQPKFCIITPTAYLTQYASQSNTHLVLAHQVDIDDTYAEFYADRSDNGDFLICDNGAFELGKSYAPDKLIELATKCKAHAIVLPDYPYERAEKTVTESMALIDAVKDAGFQTAFVPQSQRGDFEDWITGYTWAANTPSIDIIGMSILGIPNALPNIHVGYARVVMTQILIERGLFRYDKYHHYLGLNAGPALELPSLIKMNAMDSCDSSGPVWAALMGHEYNQTTDSLQSTSKVKTPVLFDYPLVTDELTLNRIQHNIDLTLELFKTN